MSNKIDKTYTVFTASGYKSWSDQTPMVEIVTQSLHEHGWTAVDLTIEEAEQAIEILKVAIQEAKDYKLPTYDETPF
jgi:hypothetical protein